MAAAWSGQLSLTRTNARQTQFKVNPEVPMAQAVGTFAFLAVAPSRCTKVSKPRRRA
jgi:hypothetical protein